MPMREREYPFLSTNDLFRYRRRGGVAKQSSTPSNTRRRSEYARVRERREKKKKVIDTLPVTKTRKKNDASTALPFVLDAHCDLIQCVNNVLFVYIHEYILNTSIYIQVVINRKSKKQQIHDNKDI